MIRDVGEQEFEDVVIRSDRPVLIDFWAQWCGPCKSLAPSLEEAAQEFEGEVGIVKVDIDAAPSLVERYGVRTVPLLLMVRDGVEVARHAGVLSRSRLDAFINQHGIAK